LAAYSTICKCTSIACKAGFPTHVQGRRQGRRGLLCLLCMDVVHASSAQSFRFQHKQQQRKATPAAPLRDWCLVVAPSNNSARQSLLVNCVTCGCSQLIAKNKRKLRSHPAGSAMRCYCWWRQQQPLLSARQCKAAAMSRGITSLSLANSAAPHSSSSSNSAAPHSSLAKSSASHACVA
jgi:hypothetical protein